MLFFRKEIFFWLKVFLYLQWYFSKNKTLELYCKQSENLHVMGFCSSWTLHLFRCCEPFSLPYQVGHPGKPKLEKKIENIYKTSLRIQKSEKKPNVVWHSIARTNLNKSEWLVTNTTAESKHIRKRPRICINWNPPFQTQI